MCVHAQFGCHTDLFKKDPLYMLPSLILYAVPYIRSSLSFLNLQTRIYLTIWAHIERTVPTFRLSATLDGVPSHGQKDILKPQSFYTYVT